LNKIKQNHASLKEEFSDRRTTFFNILFTFTLKIDATSSSETLECF